MEILVLAPLLEVDGVAPGPVVGADKCSSSFLLTAGPNLLETRESTLAWMGSSSEREAGGGEDGGGREDGGGGEDGGGREGRSEDDEGRREAEEEGAVVVDVDPAPELLDDDGALWSGTNKNRDVSTGPLARSFARTAHSFACSLTSLTPSLVGK